MSQNSPPLFQCRLHCRLPCGSKNKPERTVQDALEPGNDWFNLCTDYLLSLSIHGPDVAGPEVPALTHHPQSV